MSTTPNIFQDGCKNFFRKNAVVAVCMANATNDRPGGKKTLEEQIIRACLQNPHMRQWRKGRMITACIHVLTYSCVADIIGSRRVPFESTARSTRRAWLTKISIGSPATLLTARTSRGTLVRCVVRRQALRTLMDAFGVLPTQIVGSRSEAGAVARLKILAERNSPAVVSVKPIMKFVDPAPLRKLRGSFARTS